MPVFIDEILSHPRTSRRGWIHCPLPGASGSYQPGRDKEEALENIKDAIRLILEVFREDLENLNHGKSEVLKVELADV